MQQATLGDQKPATAVSGFRTDLGGGDWQAVSGGHHDNNGCAELAAETSGVRQFSGLDTDDTHNLVAKQSLHGMGKQLHA